MKGFVNHLAISLRLHFRNRLALIYGYIFPLIFLVAFWVLYRHEAVPLKRHMGALLTVSVLGGACFGLPTTLVSERERGVWRRYRLTPAPLWMLILSTVVARYVIIATAGLLQLGLALAIGTPAPEHPLGLFVAFTSVSFAFIGLGLVMATLANNVPAVQALGQCVFLPMLIIGGVAVPLSSLPEWAQHLSAFFPGRYAVESLQESFFGAGLARSGLDLLALASTGLAGAIAGTKLFRWEPHSRLSTSVGRGWIAPVLIVWLGVGALAEFREQVVLNRDKLPLSPPSTLGENPGTKSLSSKRPEPSTAPTPTPRPSPKPPAPWEDLSPEAAAGLDYQVPPDAGVVAPIAAADEDPSEDLIDLLNTVHGRLITWPPGNDPDPLVAVRNMLSVAGAADSMQHPVERFLPQIIWEQLNKKYSKERLLKIVTWIALHPDEGSIIVDVDELGLRGPMLDPEMVRERVYLYAVKFAARLTNRPDASKGLQ